MKIGVTSHTLLAAIKDLENQSAWAAFMNLYRPHFEKWCRKHLSEPADIDDVIGQTFSDLIQGRIIYNREKGTFRSLMKKVIRNKCATLCRERLPVNEGTDVMNARIRREDAVYKPPAKRAGQQDAWAAAMEGVTAEIERIADVKTMTVFKNADRDWRLTALEMARKATLDRVSVKQFQIYDFHVLQESPVKEVMKLCKVTQNQVYLAKKRVNEIMAEELRKALFQLDHPNLPKAN